MRVSNYTHRRISYRPTIRTEEECTLLETTGRRSAQCVDVLRTRTNARDVDLGLVPAVHEAGSYDDTRRIAKHIGALSRIRAEAFVQVENVRAAETRDVATIAPV